MFALKHGTLNFSTKGHCSCRLSFQPTRSPTWFRLFSQFILVSNQLSKQCASKLAVMKACSQEEPIVEKIEALCTNITWLQGVILTSLKPTETPSYSILLFNSQSSCTCTVQPPLTSVINTSVELSSAFQSSWKSMKRAFCLLVTNRSYFNIGLKLKKFREHNIVQAFEMNNFPWKIQSKLWTLNPFNFNLRAAFILCLPSCLLLASHLSWVLGSVS